jgi:hypothetical protein
MIDWYTPCSFIVLEEERSYVHTAGGGKGYTLYVHTVGGGKGYTLHVHTAGVVGSDTSCTLGYYDFYNLVMQTLLNLNLVKF